MAKWFQKLYYKESIQAIKDSLDFLFYKNFKNAIILSLPQESENSRERIASNILNRFYKDKELDVFMAKIWKSYGDEQLLKELFRFYFLDSEPVIKEFYLANIYNKTSGEEISTSIFKKFITKTYEKEEKNLVWWMQSALRDIGFIKKHNDNWIIKDNQPAEKAFVLLLYELYLDDCEQVTLGTLLNSDFWKLLGINSETEVQIILTKSNLLNIINIENEVISPIKSLSTILENQISVLN